MTAFLHDRAIHVLLETWRWGWDVRSVRGAHPARLLLTALGYQAVVTPWRVVYVLAEREDDASLLLHELCHVAQIRRDGRWLFFCRCTACFCLYGHSRSPIEIEARAAAARIEALSGIRFIRALHAMMREAADGH
jgi:hypothetical protein